MPRKTSEVSFIHWAFILSWCIADPCLFCFCSHPAWWSLLSTDSRSRTSSLLGASPVCSKSSALNPGWQSISYLVFWVPAWASGLYQPIWCHHVKPVSLPSTSALVLGPLSGSLWRLEPLWPSHMVLTSSSPSHTSLESYMNFPTNNPASPNTKSCCHTKALTGL